MLPGMHEVFEGMHHQVAHEIDLANRHDGDGEHHSWMPSVVAGVVEAAAGFAFDLLLEHIPADVLMAQHHDHGAASVNHDHSSHAMSGDPAVGHHASGHDLHAVGDANHGGFTSQTTGFTCAVVSQKMILDQFGVHDPGTGKPVSEALLTYEATSRGWLSDQGTSLDSMSHLLELHGVNCHAGHNWHDLVHDLAQGHQVAIAVNANELWHPSAPTTFLHQIFGGHPNHAVVVKSLQVDERGHVSVTINDPGREDGGGVEYPLEQFQAALGGGSFHFVATDHAPPAWHADQRIAGALAAHADLPGEPRESPAAHEQSFADQLGAMTEAEHFDFLRSL